MATTPKTVERTKELKTLIDANTTAYNNLVDSPEKKALNAQIDLATKDSAEADNAYKVIAKNPNSTSEQISAASALVKSTGVTLKYLNDTQNEINQQANDLASQNVKLRQEIQSVNSVQDTSPSSTLAQDQAAATEAGKVVASQASPNPSPVLTTKPVDPPYVPNLEQTVVEYDALGNPIGTTTISVPPVNKERPVVYSSSDPSGASDGAEIVNAGPVSIANTSPPVIDVGNANNFQAADAAQTIQNQQSADAYASSVAASEAGLPPLERGVEAGLPPLERGVVNSPDEVKTLDLTADPLGDKITELQAGQQTGTSTLPIRNQQSGSGSPKDWRFRMSLAPSANYLYKAATPGILKPLMATNGVIFPYSPNIVVSYNASYSTSDLVHTNYKIYNYKNSSIESVSITGDFTCQDSAEANYVLAVIHFFKSVTKMFYGQDQNPTRGTPPPLVYLTGFGQYQFDMHPVVVTSFTHTFPADVDYVNAYPTNNSSSVGGQNMAPYMPQIATFFSPLDRLRTLASNIVPGGRAPPPTFINSKNINEVTRVPAKITIQLTCLPIITRNAMSNSFSLQKYASGELMRGSVNFNKTGGGIW